MAKYIVIDSPSTVNGQVMVIFDWELSHAEIAKRFDGEIISAGRIKSHSTDGLYTMMGSTTLNIKYDEARNQVDTQLLQHTLKDL